MQCPNHDYKEVPAGVVIPEESISRTFPAIDLSVKGFCRKRLATSKIPCRSSVFSAYPETNSTLVYGRSMAICSARRAPPICGMITSVAIR
jgi:hypothetical protein